MATAQGTNLTEEKKKTGTGNTLCGKPPSRKVGFVTQTVPDGNGGQKELQHLVCGCPSCRTCFSAVKRAKANGGGYPDYWRNYFASKGALGRARNHGDSYRAGVGDGVRRGYGRRMLSRTLAEGGFQRIGNRRSGEEKPSTDESKRQRDAVAARAVLGASQETVSQEEKTQRQAKFAEKQAARAEQLAAKKVEVPEPAGPVIDPGELMAVAIPTVTEVPKPAETVTPIATVAEPAKPAPSVPQLLAEVEYEKGWPTRWSDSQGEYWVKPDAEYAAICQVCDVRFSVRGAVVHGLRKTNKSALCPSHRKCRCGAEAVDVFHTKGVVGMEDADNQPVCWGCRGSLIQRQNKLLASATEPCPHVGQPGCMGTKRSGFPVCAGCHARGRTAPGQNGGVERRGEVAVTAPQKAETATVTAPVGNQAPVVPATSVA